MATAQTQEQIWQSDKSLAECLGHLFTSGIACDVTFLVEEGKSKISAHKTILISRSPVFYAMFEGDLAEKGEIVIPDVTREIFTLFLRYLYTDTIEFSDTVAMPVLSVARKYMVDHLVTKCQTFIKKSITPENGCFWLEQSHLHTEESMMEECLPLINKTPEVVLKSTSFLDLCGICVKRITESDNLNVNERMVYEAVIRWGEAECERQGLELTDSNVRKVLGDVLYTIRFPVLDSKYFTQQVLTRNVLTPEQLVNIIRHQQDSKTYVCTDFNDKQRQTSIPVKGQYECVERFAVTMESLWDSLALQDNDSISFTSSVNRCLHGLKLYGSYQANQNIDIGVYGEQGYTLYKQNHTLTNTDVCRIEFDQIIRIIAGQTYTIVLHGGVRTLGYGTEGRLQVQCSKGYIRFFQSSLFPCHTTDASHGQIPGLLVSF